MPADPRTFITVCDQMPETPTIEALSDKSFRDLVTLWCYCSRNLSDGFVPENVVRRTTTARSRKELTGHTTDGHGLMAPVDGGVQMHDYLEHQRSKAEVEDLREKRRAAGSRGGKSKAERVASATANAKQASIKSVAETETDTEPEPNGSGVSGFDAPTIPTQRIVTTEDRPDVEALCVLLAQLVHENGAKMPKITPKWRDAARLLMDRDGYTAAQVEWVARWAAADEFWRSNVLSMPTLREKFEQLKMQSMRDRAPAPSRSGRRSPGEELAATIALGAQLQADFDRAQIES